MVTTKVLNNNDIAILTTQKVEIIKSSFQNFCYEKNKEQQDDANP